MSSLPSPRPGGPGLRLRWPTARARGDPPGSARSPADPVDAPEAAPRPARAARPVSIRARLVMLVLAILVPALMGAGWMIIDTIRSEREANERRLHDTALALLMAVDAEFEQRAAVARVLARSRWLDDGEALTPAAIQAFREVALQGLRDTAGWVELRGHGGVLLDTRWPPGTAPETTPADPLPLAERASVRSLRTDGPRRAHAAVVEPVVRAGRVVLNIVVGLPATQLQRLIDAQALPSFAVGALVDEAGFVVAQHPGGLSAAGGRAADALLAQTAARREGLFEGATVPGRHTVVYFRTSPRGWTAVSGLDRAHYDGLFSQTMQRVLVGAGVLLAVAVLGALSVSRRIVTPLMALKTAARRMQAGLPVRYADTGSAECDEVGRAMAEASRAIQDSRADLERQVADAVARTRLAEQRVSQTQRVGALGRLTGGVAHDFNNLLGIISNSVHLMERHAAADELQVPIAAALRAVETGSQLTQHLLRFAGRRPVRPQRIALQRYLPESEALMRSVLGRRVRIGVRVAPDTAPIRVDPGELELALLNLGLNARDAMPDGGELRLQARNADPFDSEGLRALEPPQRWVLLTVSDDGEGIAPDIIARVFEPFFTTRGAGRGSGLGLSQVHGFCAQAGGAARLDSTPGVGTTVMLLLPSADGAADEAGAAEAAATPLPATPTVAGLRVLVVEDNDDLGHTTAALLRAHGADVSRVASAAAAMALLQPRAPFDVVLSDMVMPDDIDGFALSQWIAREHPDLPVVLISGYHTRPDMPGVQVLAKPCPQDVLLAALRDAAAQARGAGPGVSPAA